MLPQFAEDILNDFFRSAAIGEEAERHGEKPLPVKTIKCGYSFGVAQAKALEEFRFLRILGHRRFARVRAGVHLQLRDSVVGGCIGL